MTMLVSLTECVLCGGGCVNIKYLLLSKKKYTPNGTPGGRLALRYPKRSSKCIRPVQSFYSTWRYFVNQPLGMHRCFEAYDDCQAMRRRTFFSSQFSAKNQKVSFFFVSRRQDRFRLIAVCSGSTFRREKLVLS